jgi:hypothetical protein
MIRSAADQSSWLMTGTMRFLLWTKQSMTQMMIREEDGYFGDELFPMWLQQLVLH